MRLNEHIHLLILKMALNLISLTKKMLNVHDLFPFDHSRTVTNHQNNPHGHLKATIFNVKLMYIQLFTTNDNFIFKRKPINFKLLSP